jgi:hypothetical protein
MFEHQVRTGGGNDPAPPPTCVNMGLAFPMLRSLLLCSSVSRKGACPLADAQKDYGHMGQR